MKKQNKFGCIDLKPRNIWVKQKHRSVLFQELVAAWFHVQKA